MKTATEITIDKKEILFLEKIMIKSFENSNMPKRLYFNSEDEKLYAIDSVEAARYNSTENEELKELESGFYIIFKENKKHFLIKDESCEFDHYDWKQRAEDLFKTNLPYLQPDFELQWEATKTTFPVDIAVLILKTNKGFDFKRLEKHIGFNFRIENYSNIEAPISFFSKKLLYLIMPIKFDEVS